MGAVIHMSLRKLLMGCPCTPLMGWSRLAACDTCGEVFAIRKLERRADGSLVRVPCVRTAQEFAYLEDDQPRIVGGVVQ